MSVAWDVDGRPRAIRYSESLWQEIVSAVMEGFLRAPWGGPETGGVLFGKRETDSVDILAFRPLSFDHANGPSFQLSECNRAMLRQMLEEGIPGLQPVGWYHSTWSNFFFAAEDREIYDDFFPEPWQISLVLMRVQSGTSTAGFFFRDESGLLRSSSREMDLRAGPPPEPPVVAEETGPPPAPAAAPPAPQTPPGGFIQWTGQHREAISNLLYGVRSNKGVVLLTGVAGSGKTTLLETLGDHLNQDSTEFAFLVNPPVSTDHFYRMIAEDLALPCSGGSTTTILFALVELARKQADAGLTTAILIDQAQDIPAEVFDELCTLDDLPSKNRKLLNIVLGGRPELLSKLDEPPFRNLKQRIVLRCSLEAWCE